MKFVLTVFFLLIAAPAVAGITFNEGKWETNFDWEEGWQHDIRGWLDPAPHKPGVQTRGGTVDGEMTTITSEANYHNGKGGKGVRFWKGSGADNRYSAAVRITFDEQQKELWVRYYFRYEEGFEWIYGAAAGTKEVYWDVNGGLDDRAITVSGLMDEDIRTYGTGDPWYSDRKNHTQSQARAAGGWNYLYPGGISDGSWHCVEWYLKMDSGSQQYDGIARIWIDGELKVERIDINFSGGRPIGVNGWSWFEFLHNQKDPGLERPYYQDVSDMVIYNQTPQNFDEHGNPFIGPVGWSNYDKQLFPPQNVRFVE